MNISVNTNDFRGIDLNVLLTFMALMRERSVTKAAARLFLGPSAVSMSLRRLRQIFGDALFVRTRQGMEPTTRAVELYPVIEQAISVLHGAMFERPVFNARTLDRTFRFAAPDDLELVLVPALLAHLREQAPKVRLAIRPSDFRSVLAALDSGDAELALTALPDRFESWHRHVVLHEESFSCLYDKAMLRRTGNLTLKQYASTPHLLLSPRGEVHGPIDEALSKKGLSREVLISVAHFPLMPFLLRKTPSLVNMPATAARFYAREFDLELSEVPVPTETFSVGLLWHARNEADAALRWLIEVLTRLVGQLRTEKRKRRANR